MTGHLRAACWVSAGVMIAVLAAGLPACPAPAAGAVGDGGRRHVHQRLLPFRVDVSRYPRVGVVVTVPPGPRKLTSRAFRISVGGTLVRPSIRRLSPADIQLVLTPDMHASAAAARIEHAAAVRFLVGLPKGAQTAVVDPNRPTMLTNGLTADVTAAVAKVAVLGRGARPGTARLATALSGFSAGPRVRRTVVLAITSDDPLGAAAAHRFRQQLAASGTALYVLDAAPHGAPAYDALAAGSGGFAARVRTPGGWLAVYQRIITDLSEQYYLRFTDPGPLPGMASITAITPAGTARGTAVLPAANPAAPPPLPPPKPRPPRSGPDRPLVWLGVLLIVLVLCYGLGMLGASRRDPRRIAAARAAGRGNIDELFFVFLLPCLNEDKVILACLDRLLSIPGDNIAVMVIDDGSDDDTVAVVSRALGDRVWLLRRTAPQARQGKGEALNAAVRHLAGSGLVAGRDPDTVIVVVVDADGRLEPRSVAEVTPCFADPLVGAVQIGVRINNRHRSRLARMQDMEFVIYTEVFQRGRRHLGSVGLGGNGQFMRLSALQSLGPSPWSRSLTDDLDLGVRLLATGWRNEYCPSAAVHQQGVEELRRLIRQRSRWFQGHLQSWKLIPLVLRAAPRRARADILYHLSSPAILLIASLLSASFLFSVANAVFITAHGGNPLGWWLASTYALTFGPALVFSSVYWAKERASGVRLVTIARYAHLYVCYSLMWYAAGWWAVGRTLRGRTGWAKTDRVTEAHAPAAQVPAPQPALADGTAAVRPAVGGAPGANPAAVPALAAPLPDGHGASRGRAGPQGRGRKKRAGLIGAATAAAIACVASGAVMLWSGAHLSGRSPWYSIFNGYGSIALSGRGTQQIITLSPGRARTQRDTHAALVLTKAWYQDFAATAQVRTVRQLRRGPAGRPNPWEVGWVVWHYTSNRHFYALTLEHTGWVLSKQDPAYRGNERFLASAKFPRFALGVPHRIGIVQIGNLITVSADGHPLARFTDSQHPYLTGGFGVYAEDSLARFSHIKLTSLPTAAGQHAAAHHTPSPPTAGRRPSRERN